MIKNWLNKLLAIYKKGLFAGIAIAIFLKILLVLFELGGLLKVLPIISGVGWLNTFIYLNIFIFLAGLGMLMLSNLMKSIAFKSEHPEAFMWENEKRIRGCWVTLEGKTTRKSDGRVYWKYVRQHIFSPTANGGIIEVGSNLLELTGRTVKSSFVSHIIRLIDFPDFF
jgi:hypothetical protein